MKHRYEDIQARIDRACSKAGRNVADITLIAVSKKQPLAIIQEAYDLGIRHFGENYIQEWTQKQAELPTDIHWHLIGPIQSKKIVPLQGHVHLMHTLGTMSQVKAWRKRIDAGKAVPNMLIQVNIAHEDTKSGVVPADLPAFVEQVSDLPICGLMCFPPYAKYPQDNRRYFAAAKQALSRMPDGASQVLSMGVSHDFEVAIEEGATHVRVGSSLLGARKT